MNMPSFVNMVGCMIAVPHSGRAIVPEFAWCLTSIHPPMNYNTRYGNIYGAPVDDAREHLAEQAILQECKYLFFMGDDVTCPGHTLRQLISFMDNNPKCAVIGGIYCQKQDILPAPLVFRGNGAGSYWDWKVGEVFEVSGIGMDCTLIRTEALKSIPRPWFKTIDDATGMIDGKYKSENWTEDLFFCFPPGQIVYGDVLPIEQYKEDNLVVAHTGKLRGVLDTNVRQYRGELIRVSPKYGASFECTPAHRIQVARDGEKEWVRASDVKTTDYLVVPFAPRFSLGHNTNVLPVWPYIRGKYVEFDNSQFRYTRTHEDSQWFPLKVVCDEDFCSLAGYWVAEGSVCGGKQGNVTFTFHETEESYATDVQRLLHKCFGLDSSNTVNPVTKVRVVECTSVALSDFMAGTFGKLSSERLVPEEIMRSSVMCMEAFLRCYWRGDGTKSDDYGLVTTSKRLVHCLRWMLIRLGIYPSLYEGENRFGLRPARQFHEEWCKLIEQPAMERETTFNQSALVRVGTRSSGGEFHVKVDSLLYVPYDGPVYNLKVQKDATYNIHGFTVHNCDKAVTAGWQVWADGGILCDHWDAEKHKPYRMDPNSKPFQREETSGLKIVDLGCGPSKYQTDEGKVIGVDIRELPGVDYRCDLHTLPFATGEFDIVFSSHTLEHFSRAECNDILNEWIRILKPDGEFRLILPNIGWVAKQLQGVGVPTDNNGNRQSMHAQSPVNTGFTLEGDILNVLYGSQEYEQNFHKNGFWPERVRELLEKRGFNKIEIDDSQYYNIITRAWRLGPQDEPQASGNKVYGERKGIHTVAKRSDTKVPKRRK